MSLFQVTVEYAMQLGEEEGRARASKRGAGQRFEMVTCRVEYEEEGEAVSNLSEGEGEAVSDLSEDRPANTASSSETPRSADTQSSGPPARIGQRSTAGEGGEAQGGKKARRR